MAFAAALTEKRGPRVGDAASLWNFTPAPGWTGEEVQILRLCLMKHGVGQWLQILGTGLLPGKLIQQVNGQTQRLLGQQSLAAFTGLRVDVDRVRADNEARTDATRKAGLIIYDGPTLTKEMKAELREEAQRKYGLTPEQLQKVDEQLEELMRFAATTAATAAVGSSGMVTGVAGTVAASVGGLGPLRSAQAHAQAVARLDPELGRLLAVPMDELSTEQLVQLLKRLRNRLACLVDRCNDRASLPPRSGPRWKGEGEAAILLDAAAAAAGATGVAGAVAVAGGPGCSRAAQQGEGLAASVASRHHLTEATACRVRSGTAAAAPRPPASGSGATRKRGKPSRTRGSGQGDGGDWSGGEENAGPLEGAKRRAESSRRGTRAKRPARYDKYVDDAEYEEVDPDAGVAETVVDPSEALNTLTAMGFTPRKARGALRECHFNVEAAVEWLFANCV
ncbi:hypothetical protein VOLCADRAFT_103528 [Volvox carteri f. nagariensis]|uniref:UBA domain-containing protein n=1 Tax=Volvox carteri f. nagariensis TaxID=3068 RepID=D8TMG2_VOLCA|nr:uncharacterized protein VOLCADRAFT_103528 [Volvox carteri f. nagariensis]EFJ51120.1 hypothetical protein VOLCADRAFT_103528 [Volvox carteri f. nagariensis]|eukprot:XP_002947587.1 hypothetical protein VOLCADRAFT_103528 [Volvox carteri f. nagariensis]